MALPSIVVLRQLARARLRQAARGVAAAVALLLVAVMAVGLAVAAGVIATAEEIGVIYALLAWSGGFFLILLLALVGQVVSRRKRRLRELERASASPVADPGATLMSDAGFRAGMQAASTLPPIGAVAAAFVIGTLIARGGRR